jgi:tetratricopeptide (TPR) repeat protein
MVVLKDVAGRELRRVPATALSDGSVVLSRSALIGASSSALADSGQESKLVTGDDPEYNLARLWFGGHTEALSFAPIPAEGPLHSPLVETTVEKLFDSPNFGPLWRLQTRKLFPRDGQLLLDDHDRPVAWYEARLVDGQLFAFALPPERLTAIPPVLLGLAEWNSRRLVKFDEAYQRAVGYMWVEDYEGAAYYLREAVKLNPKSARAWFHLAFAEGKRGKGNERIACYLKALELDNSIAEAHYNLALAMIMKGDSAGAEAHLAQLYRLQSPLAEKLASFVGLIHVDELPAKDERGTPAKL